jgi:hypothetical protein
MTQPAADQRVASIFPRPIPYRVELTGELAIALERYVAESGKSPNTIINEAIRAYLGVDA